jgi:hypothetical protein
MTRPRHQLAQGTDESITVAVIVQEGMVGVGQVLACGAKGRWDQSGPVRTGSAVSGTKS